MSLSATLVDCTGLSFVALTPNMGVSFVEGAAPVDSLFKRGCVDWWAGGWAAFASDLGK